MFLPIFDSGSYPTTRKKAFIILINKCLTLLSPADIRPITTSLILPRFSITFFPYKKYNRKLDGIKHGIRTI